MGKTEFLNVDLDVMSKRPLGRLVTAFGEDVFVLYCGRWGDRYSANFEVDSGHRQNANTLIRRFTRLIEKLEPHIRKLWDQAESREFNIGVEAAHRARTFELRLRPTTLKAVAQVNGTIAITVYAPERIYKRAGPKRSRARKKSSNQAL
ncbi:MAG TPA: hypothetical protein VN317_04820 [Candidatus Methanoperedens sp.]|nr:hypothetical protein [Candidatus Methanoperedens sp.]